MVLLGILDASRLVMTGGSYPAGGAGTLRMSPLGGRPRTARSRVTYAVPGPSAVVHSVATTPGAARGGSGGWR
jgi:hypothetical protein